MGVNVGGGRTEAIKREIASLRAQRDELDARIRFFESQLLVGAAAPTKLPPSLSAKLDAAAAAAAAARGGGLSPTSLDDATAPSFSFPASSACKNPQPPKNAAAARMISCREYKRVIDSGRAHLLLDVRPAHHFQAAAIAGSVNIPLHELREKLPRRLRDALSEVAAADGVSSRGDGNNLYFVCQSGEDSEAAVGVLRENGFPYASAIAGGLECWAREVDPDFPVYW